MARAIVTLCCSPPDICAGLWCIRSPMPTCLRSSLARLRRADRLSFPLRIIGISTFSRAVIVPRRLKVWKTKPIFLRRIFAS
mmetsp:Transcript_10913/g.40697  ORF Transcript_10913/g.40697 Transcript_10913/m.40697 type:complete len:82 (-) Transcript_10913:1900-2145(-)